MDANGIADVARIAASLASVFRDFRGVPKVIEGDHVSVDEFNELRDAFVRLVKGSQQLAEAVATLAQATKSNTEGIEYHSVSAKNHAIEILRLKGFSEEAIAERVGKALNHEIED